MNARPDPPPAVDARAAADRLRKAGGRLPTTLAEHLDATADYWRDWFPLEPTAHDRTAVRLVAAVLDTYPGPVPASQTPAPSPASTATRKTPKGTQ